jgi:hypothetical protein
MPVNQDYAPETFDGNGSTSTPYPISLERINDADLKLTVGGVEESGFTIAPDGLRTNVAVPPGTELVLYRITPRRQTLPYPINTTPAPEDVRVSVDQLTMLVQELEDETDRSIKAPVGGTFAADITFGTDENGDIEFRTVSEQITFLGIGDSVDAAAASAAAAANSATAANGWATSAEEQAGFANDERVIAEAAATAAATSKTNAENSASTAINALEDLASYALLKLFVTVDPFASDPIISGDVTITLPGGDSITIKNSARPYAEPNAIFGVGNRVSQFYGDIYNIIAGNVTDFDTGEVFGTGFTTVSNYTPFTQWDAVQEIDDLNNRNFELVYYGTETNPTVTLPTPLITRPATSVQPSLPFVRKSEEPITNVEDAILRASHCWLAGESDGTFYDCRGGLNLTNSGAAGATSDTEYGLSRVFIDSNSEYAGNAAGPQINGGPFWFAAGINIDSTASSTRAILGQSDYIAEGSTTDYTWVLIRTNNTTLRFKITRSSGVGTTEVDLQIAAATYYNVFGYFDGTNLHLYANGESEVVNAPYGLYATNKPFALGKVYQSGAAAFNYFDGKIGYCMFGFGAIDLDIVRVLNNTSANEWRNARRRFQGLGVWGDSLSDGDSFANKGYIQRTAEAASLPFYANHAVGGENSTGTESRASAVHSTLIGQFNVVVWVGNNNPEDTDQVLSDAASIRRTALDAGTKKVVLLGLPNRSFTNATAGVVDALQADLNTINTGLAAIAAANSDTEYLDVHDLFVNNYPTAYTAQAGAATTITLADTADDLDDTYNNLEITIISGTGSGQTKTITDYVGSTRVATVDSAWSTNPDATSVYTIGLAADATDQFLGAEGIVPRSARDTPGSLASTHFGDVGMIHISEALTPLIG